MNPLTQWVNWVKMQRLKQTPEVSMAIKAVSAESARGQSFQKIGPLDETQVNAMSPEERMGFGIQTRQRLTDFTKGDHQVAANMTTKWSYAVNTRRQYLAISEELRRFYLTETILMIISEDVCNATEEGEILEVTSDNEVLNAELKRFQEKWNLNAIIGELMLDFINLGEYTLRMTVDPNQKEGIVEIADDVNQIGICALYDRGLPSSFLVFRDKDLKVVPPHEYAHFVVEGNKLRIKMDETYREGQQIDKDVMKSELQAELPDYIRVGKPFFYGTVGKIRELQILEQLIPATKLNNITQSKIVLVRMPVGTPPDQVNETLAHYEQILNTQTGVDLTSEQITLAEIVGIAGRIKPLPDFSDGKGHVEPVDVRGDPQVDDILHSLADIREAILSNVGIPYSFVFGPKNAGDTDNKATELRQYGRYTRRLARIQRAIRNGVEQMVIAHCRNTRDFQKVTRKDFRVKFKQVLTDLSALEKLECDDAKQEIIGRKIDFVTKMRQDDLVKHYMDEDGVARWLAESFDALTNGIEIFNAPEKDGESPVDNDGKPTKLRDTVVRNTIDRFQKLRDKRTGTEPEEEMEDQESTSPDVVPFVNKETRSKLLGAAIEYMQKYRDQRAAAREEKEPAAEMEDDDDDETIANRIVDLALQKFRAAHAARRDNESGIDPGRDGGSLTI